MALLQIPAAFNPTGPIISPIGPEFNQLAAGGEENVWYVSDYLVSPRPGLPDPNPNYRVFYSQLRSDAADVSISAHIGAPGFDPGMAQYLFCEDPTFVHGEDGDLISATPEPEGDINEDNKFPPPGYQGTVFVPDNLTDMVWTAAKKWVITSPGHAKPGYFTDTGYAPRVAYIRRQYDATTSTHIFTAYVDFFVANGIGESPPVVGWGGDLVEWEIDGVVTTGTTTDVSNPPPSILYQNRQSISPIVTWAEGERPLVRVRVTDKWGQKSSWQRLLFWPVPPEDLSSGARFIVRASGEIKSRPKSQLYQHAGAARIYAHEPATGAILVSDDEGATYQNMANAWSDIAGAKPIMTESLGDAGGMSIARVGNDLQFRSSADNETWEAPVTVAPYGSGGWCVREHLASGEALLTISNMKDTTLQSSDSGATWEAV